MGQMVFLFKRTFFVLIIVAAILIPRQVLATPAGFDWGSFDSAGNDANGVYEADNSTVLQTGYLAQFIWTGPDGSIDPPQPDGTPGDDDQLLDTNTINNGLPLPPDLHNKGYIPLKTFSFDNEDQLNGGTVYIRAWNGASPAEATAYGDSDSGVLSDGGVLNAPRWHVIAPTINHTPLTSALSGYSLPITATIISEAPPITTTLYYSSTGDSSYTTLHMINTTGDIYSATIPAGNMITPTLSYYIEASDAYGISKDGPHLVSVVEPNIAPVAVDDSYMMNANDVLSVPAPGVLDNDSDGDGDPLTAVLVTDVNSGTLALVPDGSFTYTPTTDYSGRDHFIYKANDGLLDSNTVVVTITISPPKPSTPVLLTPDGLIADDTPMYSWVTADFAETYLLLVVDDQGSAVVDETHPAVDICFDGTCTFTPTVTLPYGYYSWYVRARNDVGSTWSSAKDFVVYSGPPPSSPAINAPIGTIFEQSPIYSWNEGANALQYQLLVADGDRNTVINRWYSAAAVCSAGVCSAIPPEVLVEGDYLWFIKAVNPMGRAWSAGKNFTVFLDGPPESPTIIGPIGATSEVTPTYSWYAGANAQQYQLLVTDLEHNPVVSHFYAVDAVCSGNQCSVNPAEVLPEGEYLWFAKAMNPWGNAWSVGKNFTVFLGGPPTKPVLIAPIGVTGEVTPTYSWAESVDGHDYYLLVVDEARNVMVEEWHAAEDVCSGGVCTVTSTVVLNEEEHLWFVRASNPRGRAWSAGKHFTVFLGGAPGTPVPTAPTGTISEVQPTYSWIESTDALQYLLLVVDSVGNTVINNWYSVGVLCTGGVCSATPSEVLTPGDYSWYVKAGNPLGSVWSSRTNFTVVP